MRRALDSTMPRKAPKVYAKMMSSNRTEFAALKVMLKYTPRVIIGLKCPPEMGAKIV